jgi:hypothetical protein
VTVADELFSRATFGAFLVVATLQAILIHANLRVTLGRCGS